jgi:hypothetical protein
MMNADIMTPVGVEVAVLLLSGKHQRVMNGCRKACINLYGGIR